MLHWTFHLVHNCNLGSREMGLDADAQGLGVEDPTLQNFQVDALVYALVRD